MARRLRLGILGLGRRWPRYRHALAALADDVRAVAVHDGSLGRAEAAAADLGCEAVGGVVELVGRDDVDAVVLVGGLWHRLWALDAVVKAGKPVLCAVSPAEDVEHLPELRQRLGGDGRVHMALWPTLTILREAMTERLEESLGRPLLVQATWTRRHESFRPVDLLASPAAVALARECAELFGSPPAKVTAQAGDGLATVVLHFAQQRVAQLTLWAGPAARGGCRVQVEAESGGCAADLPRTLTWHDDEGRHRHRLHGGMAEMLVVDRFVQAVRAGQPSACTLGQACEPLDWLRQASR